VSSERVTLVRRQDARRQPGTNEMAATHERKYWDDLALPNQGPNGAGISGMVPLRQITHVQESVETHIDSGVLVARVEVG
jgi:hypothetical protein